MTVDAVSGNARHAIDIFRGFDILYNMGVPRNIWMAGLVYNFGMMARRGQRVSVEIIFLKE